MNEPVFEAPWQATAFALVVNLHARGAFEWKDWSECLGATIAAQPDAPYYDSWLAALEAFLVQRGICTSADIEALRDAWLEAERRTPHGQPIELDPRDRPRRTPSR